MPINIYIEETFESITGLCDNDWGLPGQIEALETWLNSEGKKLKKGAYVADIGFDIRKDATGGGGVMSSDMMKLMSEIGMAVYFSEYPSVKIE